MRVYLKDLLADLPEHNARGIWDDKFYVNPDYQKTVDESELSVF